MKLKNVSNLPATVVDEHTGRGALVDPGGETPELSEQAARELLEHAERWAPVEKAPVRASGKKGKG